MTLEEEFVHYVEKIYPDPPARSTDQWRQLRDAFYGGCLVAYSSREDFSLELQYRHKELKAGIS